jgi:hypothetical protein
LDTHTQIQDTIIQALKDALGDDVKGVHKLVDRPLTAGETPAVIVEVGAEQAEYEEFETPPNRLVERSLQVVCIVTVDAAIRAFAPTVRGLSDRVRKALSGFRRWGIELKDVQVTGVVPEDYPSETGRQAGHTLNVHVVFKSRENTPDVIERLRG